MAAPTIVATGSTTPANSPGVSKAYVQGETLTFSDPANGGATTHLWTLVDKPAGQTSSLVGPTTATPTLLLDAAAGNYGTFRIRYTADGVDTGELLLSIDQSVDGTLVRIAGYLEQDDARAAATEATWNLGSNIRGWAPAAQAMARAQNVGINSLRTDLSAAEADIVAAEADIVAAEADIVALQALVIGNPLIDGEHKLGVAHLGSGNVVSIAHTLGRAFKGFQVTNGLKAHLAPTQTDPTTQIDLILDPWYTVFKHRSTVSTTTVDATGLDGDKHKWYRIGMRVIESSIGSINLWPNQADPGAGSSYVQEFYGNVGANTPNFMGIANSTDDTLNIQMMLHAETGAPRLFRSEMAGEDANVARPTVHTAVWTNTVTNITSLRFTGSAGWADIGTEILIEAREPDETDLEVWVF